MTLLPPRIEGFRQKISWREIEQSPDYSTLLECCIKEDLNFKSKGPAWQNDLTSSLCSFTKTGIAQVTARESFVLCGIKHPIYCFSFSPVMSSNFGMVNDGDLCKPGDVRNH